MNAWATRTEALATPDLDELAQLLSDALNELREVRFDPTGAVDRAYQFTNKAEDLLARARLRAESNNR